MRNFGAAHSDDAGCRKSCDASRRPTGPTEAKEEAAPIVRHLRERMSSEESA
jgi:hypothetical protein